jgi:hypothetical protein
MVHANNPSIHKAEAGRLQVGGQPGQHIKTLSQKKQNKIRHKHTYKRIKNCC